MGRERTLDRDEIIRLHLEGLTNGEIAEEIGAKSPYHISTIVKAWREDPANLHKVNLKPPHDRSKRRKVKLDVGKVRALQRAGWSAEKIRFDMGPEYTIEEIKAAMMA